jgi:hypothetical protein
MRTGIFTTTLIAALVLITTACGTSNVGTLQDLQRGTSGFAINILRDNSIAGSTAQGYSLSTEDSSRGVLVHVNATGASNLKALYFEMTYDAAQYTPKIVDASNAMGDAADLLCLQYFKEPGKVTYGQVLANWEQRSGFSGSGTIASVLFEKTPATVGRQVSAAGPPSDANSSATLLWDSGTTTLSWYYRNTGDYDQNFQVGIQDLTPLGAHWNDAAATGGYAEDTIASVIDGNPDGAINIGDLTPLGANFGKDLSGGYNVYHSTVAADYPAGGTLLGNVARTAATGAANLNRLHFLYKVSAPVANDCYWVKPNDAEGGAGTDGTASTMVSTSTASDGIYEQNGGTNELSGKAYSTDADDTSGVHVYNAGKFTLHDSSITTSGDTSSMDNSSFIGQNAAVLSETGSTIDLLNCTINTTGTGANGLFAYGAGSVATLTGGKIVTTQGGAHGVDATGGGSVTISDVDIETSGNQAAAAISTDRGGGTVNVTGGVITTAGGMSPTVYSTGNITVTGASLTATGCEGTTMDGNNSITLNNCTLVAAKQGCKFMNTVPSGMTPGSGSIVVNGGSITAQGGDLFYVLGTNTLTVNITVENGATLAASTGYLADSTLGAVVSFTAIGEALVGNLIADSTSTLTAALTGSTTLEGMLTNAGITLDATSSWTVTGDCALTSFSDASGISGTSITNVYGNGHTVTYDSTLAANSALGGQTFTLNGGGTLTPAI